MPPRRPRTNNPRRRVTVSSPPPPTPAPRPQTPPRRLNPNDYFTPPSPESKRPLLPSPVFVQPGSVKPRRSELWLRSEADEDEDEQDDGAEGENEAEQTPGGNEDAVMNLSDEWVSFLPEESFHGLRTPNTNAITTTTNNINSNNNNEETRNEEDTAVIVDEEHPWLLQPPPQQPQQTNPPEEEDLWLSFTTPRPSTPHHHTTMARSTTTILRRELPRIPTRKPKPLTRRRRVRFTLSGNSTPTHSSPSPSSPPHPLSNFDLELQEFMNDVVAAVPDNWIARPTNGYYIPKDNFLAKPPPTGMYSEMETEVYNEALDIRPLRKKTVRHGTELDKVLDGHWDHPAAQKVLWHGEKENQQDYNEVGEEKEIEVETTVEKTKKRKWDDGDQETPTDTITKTKKKKTYTEEALGALPCMRKRTWDSRHSNLHDLVSGGDKKKPRHTFSFPGEDELPRWELTALYTKSKSKPTTKNQSKKSATSGAKEKTKRLSSSSMKQAKSELTPKLPRKRKLAISADTDTPQPKAPSNPAKKLKRRADNVKTEASGGLRRPPRGTKTQAQVQATRNARKKWGETAVERAGKKETVAESTVEEGPRADTAVKGIEVQVVIPKTTTVSTSVKVAESIEKKKDTKKPLPRRETRTQTQFKPSQVAGKKRKEPSTATTSEVKMQVVIPTITAGSSSTSMREEAGPSEKTRKSKQPRYRSEYARRAAEKIRDRFRKRKEEKKEEVVPVAARTRSTARDRQ
ncbi:hypothetical protein EX30DRAFT_351869 [Ascodesmis nigricans]|uniref:Uncharacterized protein n=1 Tax=Ascodesmis nigricans TaxID=341454 RepID=A0A4S2MPW2_9PEZI|nr:hypothetical protein EX30DRAFT_351869 [Ascodesmis nigricans]